MWGALLRGLTFLPMIGKGAINWAKNHKATTGLGLTTLGAIALSGKDKNTQQQEQEQSQSQQQEQKQTTQQKQTPKTKNKLPNLQEKAGLLTCHL